MRFIRLYPLDKTNGKEYAEVYFAYVSQWFVRHVPVTPAEWELLLTDTEATAHARESIDKHLEKSTRILDRTVYKLSEDLYLFETLVIRASWLTGHYSTINTIMESRGLEARPCKTRFGFIWNLYKLKKLYRKINNM